MVDVADFDSDWMSVSDLDCCSVDYKLLQGVASTVICQ